MAARGHSFIPNFGVNYIKNGVTKLDFTVNCINFDVIHIKIVLKELPQGAIVNLNKNFCCKKNLRQQTAKFDAAIL